MSRIDEDRAPTRKAAQLCKQIERALVSVLASAHEPSVRDLVVASVEPIAGSQVRAILLAPVASFELLEPYRGALEKVRGYVRTEIAQQVNRKRAPELQFALLPGAAPQA